MAPVKSYAPNDFGLYNMLGNVWEWVLGGKPEERILRGGSFVDSKDGSFNHIVMVSTRQLNAGDSGASNIGFRCASSSSSSSSSAGSSSGNGSKRKGRRQRESKNVEEDNDRIEL